VDTADAAMVNNEDNELIIIIAAGQGTIVHKILCLVEKGCVVAMDTFHHHTSQTNVVKHIQKATKHAQLDEAAARNTAVIESKYPVQHSTIHDLICEESKAVADSTVDTAFCCEDEKIKRELWSLKAKMNVKPEK